MTPHENMLLTIELLAKRKEAKRKKAEWEVKSYISSCVLKARAGRQKRPIY